jgi:hypothetical protein
MPHYKYQISTISNIIPISPSSSPTNKISEKEYSLKEHFFDPSKCSPPNEFLKKLQSRINNYKSNLDVANNNDKLDIEYFT